MVALRLWCSVESINNNADDIFQKGLQVSHRN